MTNSISDYPTAMSMDYASMRDAQALEYARGTLELRKKRNRKRTVTGEYVWSEEADLIFALALITWTGDSSCRAGTKRSFFLESFLSEHGIKKTRKQIASRLQVLKGEWHNTPYSELLKHPHDAPDSRGSSLSPSLPEDRSPHSVSNVYPHLQMSDASCETSSSSLSQDELSFKSPAGSSGYGESSVSSFRGANIPTKRHTPHESANQIHPTSSLRPHRDLTSQGFGNQNLAQYLEATSINEHPQQVSRSFPHLQTSSNALASSSSPTSFNYNTSSHHHMGYEDPTQVPRSTSTSVGRSFSSQSLSSPVDPVPTHPTRSATFPNVGPSLSHPLYSGSRPLAGLSNDYNTNAQISRVGLNEPHLDINRRQNIPSQPLSHDLNDALVSPVARYPNDTHGASLGGQAMPSIVSSTITYTSGSFHSTSPGEEGSVRGPTGPFYPGNYQSSY